MPTYIQQTGATASGSVAYFEQSLSVTAGNLVIASAACWHSLGRFIPDSGITSSPSLTWTRRVETSGTRGIWTAIAGATGTLTVRVTPSASDYCGLSLIEASVVGAITCLSHNDAVLSGTSVTSGNVSPTGASILIGVMSTTFDPTSITPNGAWTAVYTDPSFANLPWSTIRRSEAAAGTFAAQWTVGSNPGPGAMAAAVVAISDSIGAAPHDVPVVTIAGVLAPLRRRTLTISEVTNGRNTLSADVISLTGTYRPAVDAEVLVYINSVRIFGGVINSTQEVGITGGFGDRHFIRVRVNDYNSLADRRFVLAGGFPAGYTLLQALTAILGYLSPYGVTLDAGQVTGPTLPLLEYAARSITSILDELAMITGYVWEIDYDKVLRMYAPGTVAAPFDVIDGDDHAIGDIAVDQTARTSYANRIIFRAGTDSVVEKQSTFTGNGVLTSFTLPYTLQVLSEVYLATRGYVTNNAVNETLGAGATWSYNAGTNAITRTSAPGNGNAISLYYDVEFPITVIAEDVGDQAIHGIFERLVENPDVFDIDVAQDLADAELLIGLERPNQVRYTTRRTGLKPGMTQTITAATRAVNDTYLVSDIQSRDSGDDLGTLIREVTATQGTILKSTWRETYKRWSGLATSTVG